MPRLSKIGAAALGAFGFTGGGAAAVTASYLIVAGGAGGGSGVAGGGGAGGLLTSTTSLNATLSYTIVVGAGGAGGAGAGFNVGASGSNSSAFTITSTGGGFGATGVSLKNGGSGGSGGGGGSDSTAAGTGGAGTAGQGNNGGNGFYSAGVNQAGGGGGGASAVGAAGTGTGAGAGGAGSASSITGTSVTYAGGGGGGNRNTTYSGGAGGAGGGGAGSNGDNNATSGSANTGGGGGGSGYTASAGTGGNGGSGIVIISYAGAQQFGGGIVTSVGGNTIHTFNTSGTLVPLSSLSASYLIVAGGGGGGASTGGRGGGGGAGGMLTGSGVTIDTSSTYLVTVGAGGTAGDGTTGAGGHGGNGTNSTFSMVSTASVGGGGGGANDGTGQANGNNGGSGGGAHYNGTAGTGTSGQGNNGGTATVNPNFGSGGGGGAGAVGANGTTTVGGNGGVGLTSSISGTSTYYAGGGGGQISSGTPGTGGLGGGGAGTGVSGTANTGGGGGGLGSGAAGGSGGSGIVIISYAGATQQMAGGSVTITGGNVIHTFTSSGYLTPLTYYSNSLRFRLSANGYLNRTQTSGDRQKWTWSGWVKRGSFGTRQGWFSAGPATSRTDANTLQFGWQNDNTLQLGLETTYVLLSTQVFRDPAAWYHFVVNLDTTQATASNRMRIYVNGSEITSWATDNRATAITQNVNLGVNLSANPLFLGAISATVSPTDGYMTNVNFVDGQQLTPNSFGTFNSYGVWQPINYGGSYGTNGFYLPFNSGSQTFAGSFTYASSQVLSVADNAALELGSADFCVEGWYNPTSFTNNLALYSKRANSTSVGSFIIYAGSGGGTLTFYASSDGSTYFYSGTSFGTVVLNQWNHFAVYRSGNNWYGSVNGIVTSMGSNSSAIFNNAEAWRIGGDSNGNYANGYLSNTRIVTGSPVYTSANFIPSTSPLTAITGTQLLTLQNATIVDNSTNAFTITNTGSVTTATSKALSTAVFLDQSPQGNNWTPNNISGATGSTLDYMTDVPTLTSATAANYCTLNPLMSGGTLTDGNLKTVTINNSSFGTIPIVSGKIYFECTIASAGTDMWFGVLNSTTVLSPSTSANWTGSQGLTYRGSGVKNNGTDTSYGASWTTGDILSAALDMTAGTITFYKNGVSQGVAFSSGVAGISWIPLIYSANSTTATFNFGQQPFTYTVPTGYVGLNTYNL